MTGLGHRHDWEHVIVWINNPDVPNPTILAVTPSAHSGYSKYAPPNADTLDGSSVKVNYESTYPMNHATDITTEPGEFQVLIMWDQMTEAARHALNTVSFGDANVPMNESRNWTRPGRFKKYLFNPPSPRPFGAHHLTHTYTR